MTDRAAWTPLTQDFLSAVGGEVAMTFLALATDDYARDCGPLSFSDLSEDELAALRRVSVRTIRRHLGVLAAQQAIRRSRRPNLPARSYLQYTVVGLPEIGPLDTRPGPGPATFVPSGEDRNVPSGEATVQVANVGSDSERTKVAGPERTEMAGPNSTLSLFTEDREREIELGEDRNGRSGEDTDVRSESTADIEPIAGVIQAPLQVSETSLRWTLSFNLLELERLKAAFPRVNIDERWRQWLAWVAAAPAARLPEDKFAAFYGWLKRSIEEPGSKRAAAMLAGDSPVQKRKLTEDEKLQRDLDRWRRQQLEQMETGT